LHLNEKERDKEEEKEKEGKNLLLFFSKKKMGLVKNAITKKLKERSFICCVFISNMSASNYMSYPFLFFYSFHNRIYDRFFNLYFFTPFYSAFYEGIKRPSLLDKIFKSGDIFFF
jgi:hypothetical protein